MAPTRPPGHRRWATPAQTADYLGLSARTLRAYVANGQVRAHRLGSRTIRFDLSEVDEALQPIRTVQRP